MTFRILLINPNSSAATTRMMVGIAQDAAGPGFVVAGATVTRAPAMLMDATALRAAAAEVAEIAIANRDAFAGIIVGAFGDPGLSSIQSLSGVPARGIGEAAMREAAAGGRRFGIATTTPDLAAEIDSRVEALGLASQYTGVRFTEGEPNRLMQDPDRLLEALARTVSLCIDHDRAGAVVIGGGPLGQAALELQPRFSVPVIAPIQAAVRALLAEIAARKG